MSRLQSPIFSMPLRRIDGFSTDKICFRDAKARTPHPGLTLRTDDHNERRLVVWDKFLIKHEYRIPKQQGERFVDVTNDNNLIHRKGNIVPGAMTVSKIILPLEILFSELEISSVNIKFTGSAYYSERTCSLFLWQFVSNDYIQIEVKTYQQDRVIATTIILGRLKTASKQVKEIDEETVNKKCFARVQDYFETLGIRSDFYFQKEGYKDYTYPLAYIASLPSAEIVNQLSGQGGMINILRMDFGSYERIPITGDKGPEVKLARAKKRNTFNKIMAEIAEGLVTYYRGLAIVNPIAKFHNSKEPVLDAVNKLINVNPEEQGFITPT
ncbi:MAG: hypothetical protein DYG83_13095 [Candidatus Brocadia sp. AMX2]|uniref:Uncharacterized protein n=1 Tax=Candidatus Brocadia sinica JPN1 TaxID=1197129 RepID=A0ABQ0JY06_9BACT|nr:MULTISPECIES: hypothetical protein [Brocadia]MBC6931444.1 hypothetical protein [Candidatus Brocadia sp.]MBL1167500.1 hypothetical protein [Candidatus Brocadia sp. AMX1]NOG40613.1 hypothetical protein [Planctomycetota bacterium]GIK13417.1 MAG: hypothetical protein BroJett002_21240 [Candidatus Brocadia sinica]MCE7867727.1 hypothetical protein [Candidatus Brocadia sp. AMX2]